MVEKSSDRKITSDQKYSKKESTTMLNDQTIELNFVRNRLETFQDIIMRDVRKRMSDMIDEVMQEIRQHQMQANEFRNFPTSQFLESNSTTWINRTRTTSPTKQTAVSVSKTANHDEIGQFSTETVKMSKNFAGNTENKCDAIRRTSTKKLQTLPDKIFQTRESYLTALLKVDHMKTIYHIFYIIFLVFLFNSVSFEYFTKERVTFGLEIFRNGFKSIHIVAGIWILQHAFVFGVYFALDIWTRLRGTLLRHTTLQRLWSLSCLVAYIATQILFAYLPTKICIDLNLPFVTASVMLCETVRLLMKMHSFVRTVAPRIINGKLKAEEASAKQIKFPSFNKYLYYLFAPTLLYRDEYPRTSTIRWRFALTRFLEVVAVAFLYSYIYDRHMKQYYSNFGKEEINAASTTLSLFSMLMPGMLIFLGGFYMILHAWLNFTAELLRFGDRMFYRDWWTASNYDAYYRNWNVVVHDWLYEYIYKDFYMYVFKGSKGLSSIAVFTISALFHEYILGYSLQVFFPVMFAFFGGVGVVLIFLTRYVPKNLGNIILWLSLVYGNAWMISLYTMEYFARINCPKQFNSWTDYLVPHLWSCPFK